jgi:hypothetical protein
VCPILGQKSRDRRSSASCGTCADDNNEENNGGDGSRHANPAPNCGNASRPSPMRSRVFWRGRVGHCSRIMSAIASARDIRSREAFPPIGDIPVARFFPKRLATKLAPEKGLESSQPFGYWNLNPAHRIFLACPDQSAHKPAHTR